MKYYIVFEKGEIKYIVPDKQGLYYYIENTANGNFNRVLGIADNIKNNSLSISPLKIILVVLSEKEHKLFQSEDRVTRMMAVEIVKNKYGI